MCSLRAAVTRDNNDNTLDKIVVPAGAYPLETNEPAVTDTAGVWIDGPGASSERLRARITG